MEVATLQSQHVVGAKLYANRVDLVREIRLGNKPKIAEIGVAFGDFSEMLIDIHRPSEFVAFDLFELHHVPVIWGKPSKEIFQSKDHLNYYRDRLNRRSGDTSIVYHQGDSSTLLAKYPDSYFDLIYVDGAHDFEGVKKDTEVAVKKLKSDGYLVFNDYIYFDHIAKDEYGIVPVVNDLCVHHGWRVHGFAFQTQMFCDICLVKV